MPLPECYHFAKSLQDESNSGLTTLIGKFFKPLDSIRRVATCQETQLWPPRGFGDLGRMAIYFQGSREHW